MRAGVEQDNTQCSTICVKMYTLLLEKDTNITKYTVALQNTKITKYKHTKGQQNQKTTKNWPGRGRGELKNKNKKDRKGNSKIK